MAKDKKMDSKVNQHKRLAMGEKVSGMKDGGMVCKAKGGMVKKAVITPTRMPKGKKK